MRSLLILNESLKKQEEQFRENCKAQMAALNARIEQLKTQEYESLSLLVRSLCDGANDIWSL